MPRTKLGVTAGLLAASCYFIAYFGSYVPAILLAGYILLFEQDGFLKRAAVKAITVALCFSVLVALINLIPNLVSWITSWATLFDGSMDTYKFRLVFSIITDALNIIKTLLFIVLGLNAFKGKDFPVLFVDGFLAKYL